MLSKNKDGFMIRNNIIYVQGSIDGEFKRYSTGKIADKLNINWFKKNARTELENIHKQKTKKFEIGTNFVDYAYLSLELRKSKIKENTITEYLQQFEAQIKPFFIKYDLKDITRLDLRKWQERLFKDGKKGKTISNYRGLFNSILEDARKDGLIDKNPFEFIERIKINKPDINPFSLDEILLILDKATGWEKYFIQISFFTGMRTGELMALKWEDINFHAKKINIKSSIRKGIYGTPKNESSIRTIDMLPVVEKAFIELKFYSFMKNSFVFLSNENKALYDSSTIREGVWRRALKNAKLDYRPLYQTRHTFASLMISKGEDILWVSKMLGHTNTTTTLSKYARFIKGEETKRASFLNDVFEEKTENQLHSVQFLENLGA